MEDLRHPRTIDHLIRILRSEDQSPMSWQQEAADLLTKLCDENKTMADAIKDIASRSNSYVSKLI